MLLKLQGCSFIQNRFNLGSKRPWEGLHLTNTSSIYALGRREKGHESINMICTKICVMTEQIIKLTNITQPFPTLEYSIFKSILLLLKVTKCSIYLQGLAWAPASILILYSFLGHVFKDHSNENHQFSKYFLSISTFSQITKAQFMQHYYYNWLVTHLYLPLQTANCTKLETISWYHQ